MWGKLISKRKQLTPHVHDSSELPHVRWGSWECKHLTYKINCQNQRAMLHWKKLHFLISFEEKNQAECELKILQKEVIPNIFLCKSHETISQVLN